MVSKGFSREIVAGIPSIAGIFAAFSIAVKSEMKAVTKMAMWPSVKSHIDFILGSKELQ